MLNEKPFDLIYWTLRLYLSINVDWHINGTVVPIYAWRMLNVYNAELYLRIPDEEG
jgi:hypothetical protein